MGNPNRPASAPPAGPPEGTLQTPDAPPPPIEPIPAEVKREGKATVAAAAGRVERMRKPLTTQERFSRMLTQYVGATGSLNLQNKISEKGLKDYFGVEIKFGLDEKGAGAAVAAVRQKQIELNTQLKAKNKPPILVDGILGPQTFGAIKTVEGDTAVALLKEGKKEETKVATAPAAAPAPEKILEKPKPPEIPKLAAFPKQAPGLPVFADNKFYEIEDLPPKDAQRYGVSNGEVVYLIKEDGNARLVEKSDGSRISIHKEYLNQLGTDANDDRDKKDKYIVARFEKFKPTASYLADISVDRGKIFELDGNVVCIKGESGAGMVDVIGADGLVIPNVLASDLDVDVDDEAKNKYIVSRFRSAQGAYQRTLQFADTVASDKVQLFAIETPENLGGRPKMQKELRDGKSSYEGAKAYVEVANDTRLVSIADETGRPQWTSVNMPQGTTVAVLGETQQGKYYRVATEHGVVAYLQKSDVAPQSLAATKPNKVKVATT